MANTNHADITGTNVHLAYRFSYADTTAREAATVAAGDVGSLARQLDDNSIWILTDDSPLTWVQVGGSSGSGDFSGPASSVANHLVSFSDTGGKTGKDSGIYLPPATMPVSSSFAWINQGTATVADSVAGMYMYAAAAAGHNKKILKKAVPGGSWTITVAFRPLLNLVNYNGAGIGWRQSSDGKIITFGAVFSTTQNIEVAKLTNPTTWSASYWSGTYAFREIYYLRIADNTTNRICSISADGVNWQVVHTVGRTDFLTADEVFCFVDSNHAASPSAATFFSWVEA